MFVLFSLPDDGIIDYQVSYNINLFHSTQEDNLHRRTCSDSNHDDKFTCSL